MSKTSKWLLIVFSIIALFAIAIVAFFISLLSTDDVTDEITSGGRGTVAIVEIKNEIVSSEETVRQLKRYRENLSVDAVVVRIESPGGGVSASQEIFEEMKKTQKRKPVVVSMGSVATSGGYYIALGATKIVANPGTITGSIGVISQFIHINQLLDKIGVSSTTIKSGKYKDIGSPFRQSTEEEKKYFQEMIDDVYDQFVSAVAQERKLEKSYVKKIADGRVYTGRKAYELKLIDTLGTYSDAIKVAASLANISSSPSLMRERKKEKFSDILFGSVTNELKNVREQVTGKNFVQYLFHQPQ